MEGTPNHPSSAGMDARMSARIFPNATVFYFFGLKGFNLPAASKNDVHSSRHGVSRFTIFSPIFFPMRK